MAMAHGIDLAAMKHNGKVAMARGMLDAWNKTYAIKYGSNMGTAGIKESIRRNVKTTLGNIRRKEGQ